MTKSVLSVGNTTQAIAREPRPFLFLEPARTSSTVAIDPIGLAWLAEAADDAVPTLVRSIVNFSIALQNRSLLERGKQQPIQVSVLNRRRRAARAWINAVLVGGIDAATQQALTTQWIPTLCGSRPGASEQGGKFVEFLRGSLTSLIFSEPAGNLLGHARALHVVESVLAVHLAALRNPRG
jgi:hypothetical protein